MYEVAYNLDAFAPKTEKQHEEELRTSSLRLVKIRRNEKKIAPVKVILVSAVIVFVAMVMIYSQVVLTELTAQVDRYTKSLNELEAVKLSLEGTIEEMTSIKTLEKTAEEVLGLAKIDSSQIEYVNLTSEDEIIVEKTGGRYLIKEYWDNFIEFVSECLHF